MANQRQDPGQQPRPATQRTDTTSAPQGKTYYFAPGKNPFEQGSGETNPETIKEHQQGEPGAGRGQQSGSHTAG